MRRLMSGLAALVLAIGLGAAQHPASPVEAAGGTGGALLDGFGGIHVFGGSALDTTGAPYWPNWAIARSLALKADTSGGWMLDGFGGVHAFGQAMPVAGFPYWPNWDIARAIVLVPNETQGYELDGFGGVHPLNGARELSGFPYWPNWDIARGLDIHTNAAGIPDGGWTLDGFGGIHAFGNAPTLVNPHYTANLDLWKKLHVVAGGAYVLAVNGIVETVGAPGGVNWAGYPSWGAWDIVTDVVPINAVFPLGGTPAPDRAQLGGAMDYLHSADRIARGLGSLTQNARLAAIAGNGATFNLGACGSGGVIGDRSQDMYLRDYFAHPIAGCPGSQNVFRTYELGWSYRAAGENLAWIGGTSDTIDTIVEINSMWLNSPDHYANVMSRSFSSIGCGTTTVPKGTYQGYSGPLSIWTCEFLG